MSRRDTPPESIELQTFGGGNTDPDTADHAHLIEVHSEGVSGAQETVASFVMQAFPSMVVAGVGMVAAGVVLDVVQHWRLFVEVSELFILVPALLGLKGNLEMTLASRLSTASARGDLDGTGKWDIVTSNLLLVQVQGIIVALAASIFSIIMGVVFHNEFSISHSMLLIASSTITASFASALLGTLMATIVVTSKRFNVDPDNVATPIAAALGDLVTLSILAMTGSFLYSVMDSHPWIAPTIALVMFCTVLPLAWSYISNFPPILEILKTKWVWLAILIGMGISSVAGVILERFVNTYAGMAVLSPVINGIGGNLGAVHASRISTAYHTGKRGGHGKTMRVLIVLVVPLSILFLLLIHAFKLGHTAITPLFATGYCFAALFQVLILLFSCARIVKTIWNKGLDPDNIAIPFVTALGDFFGTLALTVCFSVLWALGEKNKNPQ